MPSSRSAAAEGDRAARLDRLIARPFAHRGLHGEARVENSLGAFRAAIAAGQGIELDVQLTADGQALVFHDRSLDRLTGETGAVRARSLEALRGVRLTGSGEPLPSLDEVLALIGGRVGLLIEVKAPDRDPTPLCRAVETALGDYGGDVGVMSFNPWVPRWFAAHAPDRLRGLVVTEEGEGWRGPLVRRLALLWARPDFLAYDIESLPSRLAARERRRGRRILTWTCRTEAQVGRARLHADQVIHERPA